ncbi:MAG: internalization-related competence protein ComEC/Rec2 [Gemmatimonadetes bacterium]|nr:internalization-related competence protein ComEC/Rec2 [Gemmatimonadota bacterium]
MPLVALGALAYAVGLLVVQSQSRGSAAALIAAGLLTTALAGIGRRGSVALAACGVLVAGGAFAGLSEIDARARCARLIGAATVVRATLGSDAAPGAVVHARVTLGPCALPATLLVAAGAARDGDMVLVHGNASLGERGLLVRDALIGVARQDASLATLRAQAGRRIDRLFGADAPLVRALVIADMSAIPAEQRDRFAQAGLVHMLSVSGLHVAIIALALELLASALRLPTLPSRLATLVLLGLYVLAIGAPPPAVRAAVMLGMLLATRLLQRPTSVWAILAVGAAAPLVEPSIVLDLGWQLSVAGTIALVAGGALARRLIPRPWRGTRRNVARAAIVSVVATVVTAPLVAWTFGRVALLGPITNLLADPVMGVLQPVLFIAIALPIPAMERIMADAAHLLILAFDGIAAHAAAIPHAAPTVMPTALAAVAAGIASVALVVACLAARPARALGVALCAAAAMILEPIARLPLGRTELHLIDVGQGDAIALRTRAGRWIVVDAGRSGPSGDAGRRIVVPDLGHRGGPVALVGLSHPHADHVGGAASLFDALHPARFLDPGYVGTTPPYLAALDAAQRDHIPWQRVHPGDSLVVDEVVLTALAPDSTWAARLADANLASTVLSVRIGAVHVLLTGDAEAPEEDWLLAHARQALAADVLKVGHHGSATSSTPRFLAAVRPRLALISVGAHNSYGHPDREVLEALRAVHAQTLRTDLMGTIIIRTDGRTIEAESRGGRWTVPPRAARDDAGA